MKRWPLLLSSLMVAGLGTAAASEIEVEVRFIEMSVPVGVSWQLDTAGLRTSVVGDMTNVLSTLAHSGHVDFLCSPRIRTQSGSNATIKVVTEIRYPTDVDIRRISVTNGETIVRGVAVVPGHFETRDVGITLNVTPVLNTKQNMIDLDLMAEIVDKPVWKEYTATYEGADGTKQSIALSQPFFHARRITPKLSLYNNETLVMGGLIASGTKQVEKRVPILGAIPWLSRLFRSSREITEEKNLLVTVTARIVGEHP